MTPLISGPDFWFLALTVAFFAISIWFTVALNKLQRGAALRRLENKMDQFDLVLGIIAAIFLGFYLVYALLKPEHFQVSEMMRPRMTREVFVKILAFAGLLAAVAYPMVINAYK